MKFFYSILLLMLFHQVLSAQREGYLSLHEQLNEIHNPALKTDFNGVTWLLSYERFLTRFPHAPSWINAGIYLPSQNGKSGWSFYCSSSKAGIFRKIHPGCTYMHRFTLDNAKTHQLHLGLTLEASLGSLIHQRIQGESDPLLEEGIWKYNSIRPGMIANYTFHDPLTGWQLKTGGSYQQGIGFSAAPGLLVYVQGNLQRQDYALHATVYHSRLGKTPPLTELKLQYIWKEKIGLALFWQSDQRLGFELSLPLDLVYDEDHWMEIGFRLQFRDQALKSIYGNSYGLFFQYRIDS